MSETTQSPALKPLVWALVVVLLILHQDYWQWNDATLLWGFFPRTLAYQVAISIGAAVVWGMAIKFCWPAALIARTEKESATTLSDDGGQS